MKARRATQGQDPRLQHAAAEAENPIAFEAWLNTPEGREWLNTQAENDDERAGKTHWNHDGFNPVCSHA